LLSLAKREGAGFDDDRAQLGNPAALIVIEVYKPSMRPYCPFKEMDRSSLREVVFAAQIVDRP
jgi:hypothetical protein